MTVEYMANQKEKPPDLSDLRLTDETEFMETPDFKAAAKSKREKRPALDFQLLPLVHAREVQGFRGARVFFTMKQKDDRINRSEPNQDAVLADPKTGLFGVFDGLGGHAHGSLASRTAADTMPPAFSAAMKTVNRLASETIVEEITALQIMRIGVTADQARKKEVGQMAQELHAIDPELAKKALALLRTFMATEDKVAATEGHTTACVGLMHRTAGGNRYAVIANIGDGAAFLRNKRGRIRQITAEDTVKDALARNGVTIAGRGISEYLESFRDRNTGLIDVELKVEIPVSAESLEAIGCPRSALQLMQKQGVKTITKDYNELKAGLSAYLGGAFNSTPSLEVVRLEPKDVLLLATDGLTDKYDTSETDDSGFREMEMDCMLGGPDLKEQLEHLCIMAGDRRTYKYDDDMTIVAVEQE